MKLFAFALLSVASLCSLHAQIITNITVLNPSFEDDVLAPGNFTPYGPANTITDWQNTSLSGVQHYTVPGNYTVVRDGVNGAFADLGSQISQVLSDTVQTGVYTLTIASGWRNDNNYEGGTFGLFTADGTQLGDSAFLTPVRGTFLDTTLTVTVLPNSPYLGQNLKIEMQGSANGGGTMDFDDVRLTLTTTPEPSTWLLLGAGSMALAFVARRRLA